MSVRRRETAFSLLELLLVLALIGVLACLGHWGSAELLRGWQVRRAAHQVLEDLKQAQAAAERSGNLALADGVLVTRRTFLVFDPGQDAYALHAWRDADRDGVPQSAETEQLWRRALPPGVTFMIGPGVARRACSNPPGRAPAAITFAAPDYAPCLDRPCLKFDRHGFSLMGPGAIYLSDGAQSMALTATRPGHFTMCRWNGERWE